MRVRREKGKGKGRKMKGEEVGRKDIGNKLNDSIKVR